MSERSHSLVSLPLSYHVSVMKRMSTLWLMTNFDISVHLSVIPTEKALKQAANRGFDVLQGVLEDISGMEIRLLLFILV